MIALSSETFDKFDEVQHFFVPHLRIAPEMRPTMAVRTKADHEPRIIRSSVTQPANVMRFQKRRVAGSEKWRRLTAIFTFAFGARQDVITNNFASLEHRAPLRLARLRTIGCCCKCALAHRVEIIGRRFDRHFIYSFYNCFERAQLENECVAHVAFCVRRRALKNTLDDILPFKSQTFFGLSEEQEILSVLGVVRHGIVAANHEHISDLAFAEILKHSIRAQRITVTVLTAFLASDDNHQVVLFGSDNAALLLAGKPSVDVLAPIVGATNLKSPCHRRTSFTQFPGLKLAARRLQVECKREGGIPNYSLTSGTGGGRSAQDSPKISFSELEAS
ncbi:hypothetical protein XM53_18355 [Roseovarius atlanticus]|uniref:Uncharacterized protein n=1 Tax=Roseovarius atlanticus TaxID=1641875 RepID=A0A0T5NQ35_9RHOB|nr:hypothetical protein XM53_18355 [Roseovarius atlanticus]